MTRLDVLDSLSRALPGHARESLLSTGETSFTTSYLFQFNLKVTTGTVELNINFTNDLGGTCPKLGRSMEMTFTKFNCRTLRKIIANPLKYVEVGIVPGNYI
jgi:hypothetical protein